MKLLAHLASLSLILTAIVSVSGCGNRDPFGYVDAAGKVTYDDGTLIPASRIEIYFIPQGGEIDAKTHPRQGVAYLNVADGTFADVTSYKPGDGIVRGRHKVLIRTFDDAGGETLLVPKAYADEATTPLEIDTNTAKPPFVLQVAKPSK